MPSRSVSTEAGQAHFNVYGHLLPQAQKALAAALDTAYEGSADPSDDIPRIGRV